MPVNPRSTIGVSRKRSGPYRSKRPVVVLKFPPRAPMPSPTTKIVESRAISSARPSRAAAVKDNSRTLVSSGSGWNLSHSLFGEDVLDLGRPVRPGAVLAKLDGVVHRRLNLGVDLVEGGASRDAVVDQAQTQSLDRIATFPLLDVFTGSVTRVAHALGMGPGSVSVAFEQGWPVTGPGSAHCFAGDLPDRDDIVPVEAEAGHPVHRSALADDRVPSHARKWYFGRELVVLAHENHRELPDRGQVESFVKRAVVRRAITKEGDGDPVGLEQAERIPRAGCHQDAWSDDAAGAKKADLWRKQVHAADRKSTRLNSSHA